MSRAGDRWPGPDRVLHPDRQASDRERGRTLLGERAAAVPVAARLWLPPAAVAAAGAIVGYLRDEATQ